MKKYLCLLLVICSFGAAAQENSGELRKLEIKKKKLELKKMALDLKEQKLDLREKKHEWSKTYVDRSKFFLAFGMGNSFPLQKPNSLVSSLMINNKGFYVQFLSATLFVHNSWGVEVNLRVNPDFSTHGYDTTYGYRTPFKMRMHALYDDRYYVSTTENSWDGGPNVNLMAGPVYKIIKGRFMFTPKLLFGINTFSFSEGFAYLKEKNGNEIIDKSYLPTQTNKTAFAISPGFSASYRFAKKWAANIDVNYYRSATSNSYNQQTYSYKTQMKSSSTISESIVTQWVNVGAGMSFLIK